MGYYSTIEKNSLLTGATVILVNLKDILSEVSHSHTCTKEPELYNVIYVKSDTDKIVVGVDKK